MTDEDEVSDSTPSLVGRQLGRYTCLQEIGAGGMAVLYLAQRTGAKGFTKRFALKRIKPKYAADPNFTRMFMREAQLSASLDHPNIAAVVDFGQDGQEHFIVMEYVHGPDLRRLLRASDGAKLPIECALSVATRVCAALHYAHDRRDPSGRVQELVHRDVSATNVLLSLDGAVKLTDFGIAKGFAADGTGTSSSMLVGKPGYMSPEQVRCEALDRRSDVFCVGILLYEMTTGRRCFFGDSVFAVLNATQRAQYVPPQRHDPNFPEGLAAIIDQALQADPTARHASARELQLALEEFALDGRIRTSDTVLADYMATLDLALDDPDAIVSAGSPSGTSMRDAGGTAFMFSGAAEVGPPPRSAPPAPPRRAWLPWTLGGSALGLLALIIALPRADNPEVEANQSTAVVRDPAPSVASEKPPMVAGPSADLGSDADLDVEIDVEGDDADAVNLGDPSDPPPKRSRPRRPNKKRTKKAAGAKPDAAALDSLLPPSRRKG